MMQKTSFSRGSNGETPGSSRPNGLDRFLDHARSSQFRERVEGITRDARQEILPEVLSRILAQPDHERLFSQVKGRDRFPQFRMRGWSEKAGRHRLMAIGAIGILVATGTLVGVKAGVSLPIIAMLSSTEVHDFAIDEPSRAVLPGMKAVSS